MTGMSNMRTTKKINFKEKTDHAHGLEDQAEEFGLTSGSGGPWQV